MIYKVCRVCKVSKPADEINFYKIAKYKGGFSHDCRVCYRKLYNAKHGQRSNQSAAKDDSLPPGRTAKYYLGKDHYLVRFGKAFKPSPAQTHGRSWGYSSALSNTTDAPG